MKMGPDQSSQNVNKELTTTRCVMARKSAVVTWMQLSCDTVAFSWACSNAVFKVACSTFAFVSLNRFHGDSAGKNIACTSVALTVNLKVECHS